MAIVEGNLYRMEQAGEGAPMFVQSFNKPTVDILACFVDPTGIEQPDDLVDGLPESILLGREKACLPKRLHHEDVDDLFAAQARPTLRPTSTGEEASSKRERGHGLHEGIDPAFLDI